ncbi:MAG: integron cassette protein [Gammaproteobacteria bacterium HGW-Gammaproteobacteria-8]|nr:MAG: integron cassette protein [Gammaproteobacteria bacterium HGW-Gammaproteobacteria-8]
MSLLASGESISEVEVTNISSFGIWLLVREKELFLAYDDFPWFKDQPVRLILDVEEPRPGHFYWPELDVDLTEEIIEHPERFPNQAIVKGH